MNFCAGLHRFYRERDLVFLTVRYEDMSLNEQMQHRIGNLPAFRIFSQASASRSAFECLPGRCHEFGVAE